MPEGGWANHPGIEPDQATGELLRTFDRHDGDMLRAPERAWRGDASAIGRAIGMTGSPGGVARQLADVKLPANPRFTYGPEWPFVPA
ncbi:hypothetical protein ACFWIQ_22060 [Kitasatospora sp. NPDC127059]|uniref:hypothetical protein n=1 Tax=unclassified Kitasatospora TaxID=2633591 RepID=UPI0036573EE6